LITGIAGQDGTYLAQHLLLRGCQVHGTTREPPTETALRWPSLRGRVTLHQADLLDQQSLIRLIEQVCPDEIYNLAAQSFVPTSWQQPVKDADVNALGVARLLEAIRNVNPRIRLFQAGSSEVFGAPSEEPQNEQTPFSPRTPYATAKAFAHWLCVSYREKYGMFAACGILFNHESPLRRPQFVTRKVSQAVAAILLGRESKLRLGNLEGRRDWGFAGDYVRAMELMLQHPRADDYVIATGQTHSVRELVDVAFGHAGLDWQRHVEVDPALVRAEAALRRGDSRKAQAELGWQTTINFEQLVAMMVDADIERMKAEG
jgi:GDPmannose 4,6-dehydratase